MKKREVIYWIVMLILFTAASMAGVMAQQKGEVVVGEQRLGGFHQIAQTATFAGIDGVVIPTSAALGQSYELAFMPSDLLTEQQLIAFFIRTEDYFNFFFNPIKINRRTTQWHQTVHHLIFDLFITQHGRGKGKRYEVMLVITDMDLKTQVYKMKSYGLK